MGDGPQVYTSTADFKTGNFTSVNADSFPGSLVLDRFTATPFPLLWVPISGRGTVARVHTGTGAILGEYYSAPDGRGRCRVLLSAVCGCGHAGLASPLPPPHPVCVLCAPMLAGLCVCATLCVGAPAPCVCASCAGSCSPHENPARPLPLGSF